MARKALSKRMRFEVFKRDRFTCQYCGRKPPEVVLHVDHVHPVADGGTNEVTNLITSCQDCNLGKAAIPLSDVRPTVTADRLAQLEEGREQLAAYQDFVMQERADRDAAMRLVSRELAAIHAAPSDSEAKSILQFLTRLPFEEVLEAVDVTASKDLAYRERWRYFCGVCWTKIRARERSLGEQTHAPAHGREVN